jgi:hypothetical protein
VPTDDRPPGATPKIAAIISVDVQRKEIKWQEVRYKTRPPQPGQVELVGEVTVGYPLEGARLEDYEMFAIGNITNLGYAWAGYEATLRGGYWILKQLWKPDGTLLDPTGPASGCAG